MSSYHTWIRGAAMTVLAACTWAGAGARAESVSMATWGGGVGDTWRAAFAQAFEKDTGTKVKITEVPNPEAQVRTQAKAPQYNAVLVSYFEAAKLYNDGLLETFSVDEIPELANVPGQYQMKGADGRVIGAPVYFTYYGIAFNTDFVKPSEMTSWADLGNAKWKGMTAITQPIYSSTYHLTILSHALGGDEKDVSRAIPMFKAQVANASVVYTSLAQLNQLLTRGEVVAAPYYLARVWAMKRDGVKNIDISLPKEGGLMLPYMVVVPKGSADRQAAKAWLNYAASAAPQLRTAELFGYFHLNDKAVIPADQEKVLGMSVAEMKSRLFQPDWFVVAKEQAARVKTVEQVISETNN